VTYAGIPDKFKPDLNLSDLDSSALLNLLQVYSKLYLAMDASWYAAVEQKFDEKAALDCDVNAWERMSQYEMALVKRGLNIKGRDLRAFLWTLKLSPWYQLIEAEIELQDDRHATLVVTNCPSLNAFEQEGKGRENQICRVVEPRIFGGFAKAINPAIQVKCLKAPPRCNQNEICCKWAFALNDQA
jgi:hypothetical protein